MIRVFIDKRVLERNAQNGTLEPPIFVQDLESGEQQHEFRHTINAPCRVVYDPEAAPAKVWIEYEPEATDRDALASFIARAGFQWGWEALESWARRMAERAVLELEAEKKAGLELQLALAMESEANARLRARLEGTR